MTSENKMAINRSLIWILVSTLLISGTGLMGWLYYLHAREKRLHDDQYNIVALIQSTPGADALKTAYLAELLALSVDRPLNLYQFNTQEAAEELLQSPLIKEATVQKIPSGTLYIHYQLRDPIAFVGDFTNTVIDEEGYLFPFTPFFTPKRLPTLYFGLSQEECKWGSCLKKRPKVQLAFDLLCQFDSLQLDAIKLKQVDVSQAYADSYGQRQAVITLENGGLVYLRLNSDHIEENLMNFRTLNNIINAKKNIIVGKAKGVEEKEPPMVIDLRIPRLAYIVTGNSQLN